MSGLTNSGGTSSRLFEYAGRRLASSMTALWKSYYPIPPFKVEFWNENIIESKPVQLALSLVVLPASLWFFSRERIVFLVYALGTILLLTSSFLVYNSPNLRHFGHYPSQAKRPNLAGFCFNPEDLVLSEVKNRWALVDSADPRNVVAFFNQNRKSYAVKTILLIRQLGIDEKLSIGNVSFFYASGLPPSGSFPGEEARPFDPQKVCVKQKQFQAGPEDEFPRDHWVLVNGEDVLWDFGYDGIAAAAACELIKEKGFSRLCRIGTFSYWRRD